MNNTYKVSYYFVDRDNADIEYYQFVDADSPEEALRLAGVYLRKSSERFILSTAELFDLAEMKVQEPATKGLLDEVHDIIYVRNTEKEKQYGSFAGGMERAAKIWSGMTGKELSSREMYLAIVALKFSRESYNPKYDNVLDLIAYVVAMYENQKDEYDATK